MQCFETFESVCSFFIQSTLDPEYIDKIDSMLDKPSSKAMVGLVKDVKAFHAMRKSLCLVIFKYIDNRKVLTQLTTARGIVQYKQCPANSTCALSNVLLRPSNGILLIIDGTTLITIHSKYKIIIYHFWTLVHMPEEIGLEAKKWLKKQSWWQNGTHCTATVCTDRVLNYNDHVFAKGLYVKLKSMGEYIEKELPNIPIQH